MKRLFFVLILASIVGACSNDNIAEKMFGLYEDVARIAENAQSDCVKMSVDLKAYMDKTGRTTVSALRKWVANASDDEKRELDEKHKVRADELAQRMLRAVGKCVEEPGVAAVLKEI